VKVGELLEMLHELEAIEDDEIWLVTVQNGQIYRSSLDDIEVDEERGRVYLNEAALVELMEAQA